MADRILALRNSDGSFSMTQELVSLAGFTGDTGTCARALFPGLPPVPAVKVFATVMAIVLVEKIAMSESVRGLFLATTTAWVKAALMAELGLTAEEGIAEYDSAVSTVRQLLSVLPHS